MRRGDGDPVPLWWREVGERLDALAGDLRAVVAEANGLSTGRRRPASTRSLAEALYASKTRVAEALNGCVPAALDEAMVVSIARHCAGLCGRDLAQEEEEAWRHRVRTAAVAVMLAESSDQALADGSRLPLPRPRYPIERIRSRLPSRVARRRRWRLPLVAGLAVVAIAGAFSLMGESGEDLAALTRAAPACPDAVHVDPATAAASRPWAYELGPSRVPHPDRRVELHFSGGVAWAHLAVSRSAQDRVRLEWSYLNTPDGSQTRGCGSFPGRDSLAVPINDGAGRKRWARACGELPQGSFCTSFQRPPGV